MPPLIPRVPLPECTDEVPNTADVSERAGDSPSAGNLQTTAVCLETGNCFVHVLLLALPSLKEDQASRTFVSETFLERGCDRVDGVQSPELPFPASSARHLHTHISFRICTGRLRVLSATTYGAIYSFRFNAVCD